MKKESLRTLGSIKNLMETQNQYKEYQILSGFIKLMKPDEKNLFLPLLVGSAVIFLMKQNL